MHNMLHNTKPVAVCFAVITETLLRSTLNKLRSTVITMLCQILLGIYEHNPTKKTKKGRKEQIER